MGWGFFWNSRKKKTKITTTYTTTYRKCKISYACKWRHFRGVFSRDDLPKKVRKIESGIVNLDDLAGNGYNFNDNLLIIVLVILLIIFIN